MTSGQMTCPKCGEDFTYAGYIQGVWTEKKEPWTCPKCKRLITVDHEKGYGLKVLMKMEVK